MSFSQFSYWKQGINLKKRLKVKPQGATKPLIWYQILNGDFDETPYWKMAEENVQRFEQEKEDWKKQNPRASKEAFQNWERERRRIWNKQIFKLKEAHHENELKLLKELEQGLNHAFGFVCSPLDISRFEGSIQELYEEYEKIISLK